VGVEASYTDKGMQDDVFDLGSPWYGAWTANMHYTDPKIKASLGVYHAMLPSDEAPYIMSLSGDYQLTSRVVLGAYGDYMTSTSQPSIIFIVKPVKWNVGAHAQYALNTQVCLDGYVQHAALADFSQSQLSNNTVMAAVSVKI
jgi:hypothetical protein